jgi:predicted lipoprotein with Yx(FWY)xxD motif/cytochrome c5
MHRSRFKHAALGILAVALLVSMASAQEPDLRLSDGGPFGPVLVDAEGMSLYLYTSDGQDGDPLACIDACVNNWPPMTTDGDVTVSDALEAMLVGTVDRPDGSVQVTYGGRPLYTYVRDQEPGDTNGQGLGGSFFLVSATGEAAQERAARERAEMDPEFYEALFSEGATVYANQCAVCHGSEGRGQIGPALDDNRLLGDNSFLIGRILNGFPEHGMPPFRDQLDDRQVAAVATFIRDSWENDFGGILEEEVSDMR